MLIFFGSNLYDIISLFRLLRFLFFGGFLALGQRANFKFRDPEAQVVALPELRIYF
jgi:hypothetical protein